jgi:hypothetical protein
LGDSYKNTVALFGACGSGGPTGFLLGVRLYRRPLKSQPEWGGGAHGGGEGGLQK